MPRQFQRGVIKNYSTSGIVSFDRGKWREPGKSASNVRERLERRGSAVNNFGKHNRVGLLNKL